MKFLFLSRRRGRMSPFLPMGGAASRIIDIAEYCHGAGGDVTVAGTLPEERNYTHNGVSYHDLGRGYDLDRNLALLSRRHFDVIYADRGWILKRAARYYPRAVMCLGAVDCFFRDHRVAPDEINVFADVVIAASRFMKAALVRWGVREGKIEVIHDGIRTDIFFPRPDITREENLIVFCGATIASKGIGILLNAFDLAARQIPGLELEIYGSAALSGLQEFVDWPKLMKARPRIKYMGARTKEEVAYAFNRAQICVVPSFRRLQEAFGRVSLEAQACGCPVIISRSGGLPETIIEGRTGVIIDPLNETNLAIAIEALLTKRGALDAMSRQAEKHAREFSTSASGRAFLDLVTKERRAADRDLPATD